MKIVQVTYSTTAEFADQNIINIKKVMMDLQNSDRKGINYKACILSDNKTFIHTAFFNSDDDQKYLNNMPSFKHFQEQLKKGGMESPLKQEPLTLIGSSHNIFYY